MNAIKTGEWSEERYLKFIRKFEETPMLWDPQYRGKCRGLKKGCRKRLAKEMQCTANEVDIVSKRMMLKYEKEKCTENNFLKETKSAGKEFKPTFFAYKSMKFLDRTMKNVSSTSKPVVASHMVNPPPGFNKLSAVPPQKVPKPAPTHACKTCRKLFLYKIGLLQHMKSHLKACQTCGKTFSEKSSLAQHVKTHLKTCQTCGKTFLQNLDLMEHVKIHLKKPEEDDDCQIMDIPATPKPLIDISQDTVTPNNSDSAVHSTMIPKIKSEVLEKRPDVTSNPPSPGFTKLTAVPPQKRPKPTPTYACQVCERTFLQKSSLLQHMKIYSKKHEEDDNCQILDIPPIPIPFMDISKDIVAPNNSDSAVHSAIIQESESEGLEERPDVASHMVDSSPVFNKQSAVLPQKRPKSQTHACQRCGKTFLNEFRLLHHMKIHSETCRMCGEIFWQKCDLLQHEKIHSKKFDEDIDVRQVTDIPASHIPLQISEAIVVTNILDSAVGSTTNHESNSEDFEKTISEENIDDSQVMDTASHLPCQGILEANVTSNNADSAACSTRNRQSNLEDFVETNSEEVYDDRLVIDIPDSHIPLQGISEAIVTANNSDSAVRSTINVESKLEDFQKTIPEENIDDSQVMNTASHLPCQGISEANITPNNTDSAVRSTNNHESNLEDLQKKKSKENIVDHQVMDIHASHISVQGMPEAIISPNNEWKWEYFGEIKSEKYIDDCQVKNIPASHIPLQEISKIIVIPNNSDSSVSSTTNHKSKSEVLEEIVSILKDATERYTQTDGFSTYSQHVEDKLRNYSDRTRNIVESCISNVLLRADIGEFDKPPFV